MSPLVLLLVFLSVCMSSLAQILLKHGMSSFSVQIALQHGGLKSILIIATNVFIVGGLLLYAMGAVVWLAVLARIDVSIAYPFVAFGFIVTMALAVTILGETVTFTRVIGTILIAGGAILVARSS